MEIVIKIHDIPRNDHERWVLKNGTPLPKGHGRIGDLDILVKHNVISESYANMFTIIEADKEGSDGDSYQDR